MPSWKSRVMLRGTVPSLPFRKSVEAGGIDKEVSEMLLKRTFTRKSVQLLLICVIATHGFVTLAYAQGVTAELDYTVGLDDVIDFVEPGDVFTANITVHGYADESPSVVPFDVMVAIDMSGSMGDNDPDDRRLDAVEAFLQLCDQASPTPAGPIRAGIIGFRKQGRVEQSLTDDYTVFFGGSGVIAIMRGQSQGVATNIADAMAKAQQELDIDGINNTRAVILLTDGWPYPGLQGEAPSLSEQEGMIDEQLVPEARTKGFRYYTIGLGPNPYLHLADIAELTGGFHSPAATAEALNNIFTDIFDHVSKTMTANQVTLKVRRDTGVARFVPGSLEIPPGINNPTNVQLNTFEDQTQGWIDIVMGQLGNGDNATLSFKLEVLECLPVDAPEDVIEITPVRHPVSVITYLWGTQNIPYTLEEKAINCRKKPVFEVQKRFDLETSNVELTFTNHYPHRPDVPDAARTFTNIRVFEQLSQYFQFPYYGPSRFYATVERLRPAPAVPWRDFDLSIIFPSRFIPGVQGGDFLYSEIPSLGPEKSKKLRFRVEAIAWAPRDEGKLLPVDMVDPKVTAPPVPEGAIASRVYYDFGNQTQFVTIPDEPDEDVWFLPAMLPDLSAEGGRPNLYVEPSLSLYEFKNLPPEPADLSTGPQIPSSGPWPLPTNLFVRSESPDIWIDSETNGYVSNWLHRGDVDAYLENDSFNPYRDRFKGVTGQGDLFKINGGNRIYIRVHNRGAVAGQAQATAYVLRHFAPGQPTPLLPQWDTLGDAVSVPSPPWAGYQLLYVGIPPGSIERGRHTSSFGAWDGVEFDAATVMIKVSPASNEVHYSNNVTTERFLVVP